jgi:thymidylate kinase
MNPEAASVRSGLFTGLFGALDTAGIAYAIVGRTDGLPAKISSDVDFVVRCGELERTLQILRQWRAGARLSQVLQHEIGAFYFVLTARSGNGFVHFHPDVSTDFRRRTRCWLTADFLLAGRRRDAGGFWVPAPPAAFAYYLVKRIDKMSLDEERMRYLSGVFAEAPQQCEETGRRLLGDAGWETLWAYLSRDRAVPPASVRELRRVLIARAPREPFPQRLRAWRLELHRIVRRALRPTGLMVAVLGPDGAGKSTVIEGLHRELSQVFRRTYRFHLRPRLLARAGAASAPVTDPHGLPPRGKLASLAKLVFFVLDAWVGHALCVSPLKRRSSLVIFDRYAQDMLADPLRYRLSTPRWLNAVLLRPIPPPDLWLILDAPAPVLLGRKAEVSEAACAAQLAGYRHLLQELPHAVGIDTAQPQQASIAAACEAVLARMRERLAEPVI